MAKAKTTGFYTDQRGRITCKAHAPIEETDTWRLDRWKLMTQAEAARFEKEVGRAPACETCAADAGWVEVTGADATTTTPTGASTTGPAWTPHSHEKNGAASGHAAPSPEPTDTTTTAPEKPRKAKKAKAPDITLATLAERYLACLEEVRKSQGTLFSYKLELVVAMEEIGGDTKLADLTPERVLAFFICDRVMKTRSGVAKARPTFEKTRRVLRQALVWAAEAGLVAKAPLPEDAASY